MTERRIVVVVSEAEQSPHTSLLVGEIDQSKLGALRAGYWNE